MKIWVDDIRTPPTYSWRWALTSKDAIAFLKKSQAAGTPLEAMSLDHDLGGDDTTRPVVLWMCENDWWPKEVYVHSANPVGRDWLEGMIDTYKNHTVEENLAEDSDWRYENWDYDG